MMLRFNYANAIHVIHIHMSFLYSPHIRSIYIAIHYRNTLVCIVNYQLSVYVKIKVDI